MRLETFLINEGRSKSISEKVAMELLRTKCMDAVVGYDKHNIEIWRGIEDSNSTFLSVDPKSGKPRRSANTENYYTLILDNSPKWKSFPKRSESIICSTYKYAASNYGTLYLVFPYDGSRIGVCPYGDIWISFQNTLKEVDLQGFNAEIIGLYNAIVNDTTPEDMKKFKNFDEDFSTLKMRMNQVDRVVKEKGIQNLQKHMSSVYKDSKYWTFNWLKKYKGNMLELLNNIFDPNPNNFRVKKTGEGLDLSDNGKEVWTDGKSVLVKYTGEDDMFDLMNMLVDRG